MTPSNDSSTATPTPKRKTTRRGRRSTSEGETNADTSAASAADEFGAGLTVDEAATAAGVDETVDKEAAKPKRSTRKRKTRSKKASDDKAEASDKSGSKTKASEADSDSSADSPTLAVEPGDTQTEAEEKEKPKRTRRSRGGRSRRGGSKKKDAEPAADDAVDPSGDKAVGGTDESGAEALEEGLSLFEGDTAASAEETSEDTETRSEKSAESSGETKDSEEPRKRKRRGRRRSRGRKGDGDEGKSEQPSESGKQDKADRAPSDQAKSDTSKKVVAKADPKLDMGRVMLINRADRDECRIAIVHQRRLEELFIERSSAESHVGNIYKGRVTNVEPSIQAAFIDFGLPKNGFLHISDLQPQYFPGGSRQMEEVGRKTPRRDRPPIQKCLRRGQEVIVQVIKEGIGTKGPTLTTYISIPGRYLVMMPGMNRLGVSRKIEDDDLRRKMRKMLEELDLPKDIGFILRTAGSDRTKRELQRDFNYLQRLWKVVAKRIKDERAPCELYQESDLVIRTIRDVYSSDFSKLIVDDQETGEKVRDFLSIAMPRTASPVEVYEGRKPLFHHYNIEQEIDRINSRYVPLPSGGSLVIESTEALVAIDVNSGRFRDHDDAEETAYRINLEAVEEIARQLRLRDLGGLILCDLIDMRFEKHRRGVERALRDALRKHKERAKCLRMSQFGIIEMTRQRTRPSIKRSIYQDCPHCRGSGLVKNAESMVLDIMRLLQVAAHHDDVQTVEVRVAPEVAMQLQNRKRAALYELEQRTERRIVIRIDELLGADQFAFECYDARGGSVRVVEPKDYARRGIDPRRQHQRAATGGRSNGRLAIEEVFD